MEEWRESECMWKGGRGGGGGGKRNKEKGGIRKKEGDH